MAVGYTRHCYGGGLPCWFVELANVVICWYCKKPRWTPR